MLGIFTALIFLLLLISSFFIFPQLSIIPYFPTNNKDLKKIKKILSLKNNQIITDLGAGDGVIIFKAAEEAYKHNLNTKFIAIEINPILICALYIRRLFHSNKENIQIRRGDIFKMNYKNEFGHSSQDLTFYIYISPWLITGLVKKIKKVGKPFSLVSYMYPLKNCKPEKIVAGVHKRYYYSIKPRIRSCH